MKKGLIFLVSILSFLNGARGGNRTRVTSLGSWSSTIELHAQQKGLYTKTKRKTKKPESNPVFLIQLIGGCCEDRTHDLLYVKQVLSQLS